MFSTVEVVLVRLGRLIKGAVSVPLTYWLTGEKQTTYSIGRKKSVKHTI